MPNANKLDKDINNILNLCKDPHIHRILQRRYTGWLTNYLMEETDPIFILTDLAWSAASFTRPKSADGQAPEDARELFNKLYEYFCQNMPDIVQNLCNIPPQPKTGRSDI